MKGKNKFLLILSLVMIAFGGFALVVDLLEISNPDQNLRIISSISASSIFIVAGLWGIFSKSSKNIFIVGILLLLITTIDVVIGIGFFGMGIFHLTLFIWPLLYFGGWAVSKSSALKGGGTLLTK
ncbi:MAG: hypothetical protein FWD97_06245 [Defluviitaleaceae bacterium]|nr:hypothetical protein [Defluviitaleaceae bacterium]